jgi:hypothetical protein
MFVVAPTQHLHGQLDFTIGRFSLIFQEHINQDECDAASLKQMLIFSCPTKQIR